LLKTNKMKKYLLLVFILVHTLHLKAQNVKIRGLLKNSSDSIILFKRVDFDPITRLTDEKTYKAKVSADKKFSIILPETSIHRWMLEVGDNFFFFNLINSDEINLEVDLKSKIQVLAIGKHADDFNYAAYAWKRLIEKYNLNEIQEKQTSLTLPEALDKRKEIASFESTVLDEYAKDHSISTNYYNWLKTYYTYYPHERISVEKIRDKIDSASVKLITQQGLNDDYAALNSSEYNDLVNTYIHHKFNGSKYPFEIKDAFDFIEKGDILQGKTKEIALTQMVIQMNGTEDSTYNILFNKYKNVVKDKELNAIVIAARNRYLTILEEGKKSKENISQAKGLNEIFNKYKGKVVFVDFWASWCAPCRTEMPNSNALKTKFIGKDVVFLYLGYQDKKENWLAARKELEIDGEHVLLSPELIKEANELFSIHGIPHYVIIGKDGTIINKKADRPSNIYGELVKLTDK